MSILDIIKNEDTCIELVHEYFNGKYSKDEVKKLLYEFNPFGSLTVRRGVQKLSEEWNKLNPRSTREIENWYETTEFYIFDLLPWNACEMFTAKMDAIYPILEKYEVKSLVDYGGGLGITTFLLHERFPDMKITYCDFEESHQCKFFKFLMKKLYNNGELFKVHGVPRLLAEQLRTDAVLAMDCFEHIPDLKQTIQLLSEFTNLIIHDSTFHRNEAQPQHVNDKGEVWFINLMLEHNFFMPEQDFRVFRKFRMVLQDNSLAMAFYNISDDIYK